MWFPNCYIAKQHDITEPRMLIVISRSSSLMECNTMTYRRSRRYVYMLPVEILHDDLARRSF